MKEETEYRPKPMVRVGNMPILWHVMKTYSHFGFNDFILCLGYKGEMIKSFFLNYDFHTQDSTLNLREKKYQAHGKSELENWNITFAETGAKAQTGTRIKRIEKYVDADNFFVTYGDGVANLNIAELLKTHKTQNRTATLTISNPRSKWGMVSTGENNLVTNFVEKPILDSTVNSGFYVFKKKIFEYLSDDEKCILEKHPLEQLVKERQLTYHKHDGFFYGMDTYKELLELNELWNSGKPPWKLW